MTCTSCSSRVERKLNKVDGVEATVNFATESASIEYDPSTSTPDSLIEVVRGAGYDAFTLMEEQEADSEETANPVDEARAQEAKDPLRRTIVSAAISTPIMVVSMLLTSSSPTGSGLQLFWPPSSTSSAAPLPRGHLGEPQARLVYHGHAHHHGHHRGLLLVALRHVLRPRLPSGHEDAHGARLQQC